MGMGRGALKGGRAEQSSRRPYGLVVAGGVFWVQIMLEQRKGGVVKREFGARLPRLRRGFLRTPRCCLTLPGPHRYCHSPHLNRHVV